MTHTVAAGSPGMWAASEALGVVPATLSATSALGRVVDAWWSSGPRARGCRHDDRDHPIVMLPDGLLWCPSCLYELAQDTPRCAVCTELIPRSRRRRSFGTLAELHGLTFTGCVCGACEAADGGR